MSLALVVVLAAAAPSAHAGKIVDRFFPLDGASGTLGGQFDFTLGSQVTGDVAVRQSTGQVYVADVSNNRIQRFAAEGSFERAWGVNVNGVRVDEQQVVSPNANGGTYTLTFAGDPTSALSWSASTTAVRVALQNLPSIGTGNVSVSGSSSGPKTVTFIAQLGGTDVAELTIDDSALTMDGGPTTADVTTDVNGSGGAWAFEICTIAGQCGPGLSGANTTDNARNGDLNAPQGIAINQATGDVYVRDRANSRINHYDADGNFIRSWGWDVIHSSSPGNVGTGFEICPAAEICKAGASGGGAGQLHASSASALGTGIAVAPAGSPTAGHVFVSDTGATSFGAGGRRIAEYEADGDFVRAWGWNVAPSGAPGDLGTAFEICTTTCQGVIHPDFSGGGGANNGSFSLGHPRHVAVDGDGFVYADDGSHNDVDAPFRVQRFDSAAAAAADLLEEPILAGGEGDALAREVRTALKVVELDPDGGGPDPAVERLLVAGESGDVQELTTGTGPATLTDVHMQDSGLTLRGVDLNTSSGDLYASSASGSTHRVYVADDDGVSIPLDVTLDPPTGVTTHEASFSGTVNPGGLPIAYRFEVSKTGADGEWTAVKVPNVDLGDGTTPVEVPVSPSEGNATGLDACTLYRVRIVVNRGFGNPDAFSPELSFATDCVPPTVSGVATRSRGITNAFVQADINPNALGTTYRVEYGPTADYGQVVPVPAASAGDGATARTIVQEISGLTPNAPYHFRFVAENARGTTVSPDQVFVTRPSPVASAARGYELVSPPYKLGGIGVGNWYNGPSAAGTAGWASPTTERFAVHSDWGSQISDGAFAFANDVVFAERTAGGWRHRAAFTLPGQGSSHTAKFFFLRATASDFSLTQWSYPSGRISLFPETGGWAETTTTKYLRDWDGDWELLAPTDDSQNPPGLSVTENRDGDTVISDDGRFALTAGPHRGVAGDDDPTHLAFGDLELGARTVYLGDVSGGLTNAESGLEGNMERDVVNVCTLEGADRTKLPSRDGAGKLLAGECPPALPDRSARLISNKGASLGPRSGSVTGVGKGLMTGDGARVFFMSPDPVKAPDACAAATGDATSCPAQVYVRQRNEDGKVFTRWISRTEVTPANGASAEQDASLLAHAVLEGASADGDKVFFRTRSPLTADDPNGVKDGAGNVVAPPPGGVVTGTASALSDDLYMYDLPDGPDGDPATPDADPADGELVRISGGPTGVGDCDVTPTSSAALRFFAEDGSRLYFTCSAPLADAPVPANGTITAPGGNPGDTAAANIYVYDAAKPVAERWKFVARLPRSEGSVPNGTHSDFSHCATTGDMRDNPITAADRQRDAGPQTGTNCWHGTGDAAFVTFFTDGRITEDDPDTTTGDLYGYDAESGQLTRVSAPQGGEGGSYDCVTNLGPVVLDSPVQCHGDNGFGFAAGSNPLPRAGVVAQPSTAGDRIAYFQSASRLVPEDRDDGYDVYRWRNGSLSLVTSGAPDSKEAMYLGTDRTGLNVYFATLQRLTWQDVDEVLDVYSARLGGGIAQPVDPPLCSVLADGCQGAGAGPVAPPVLQSSSPPSGGDGNVNADARRALSIAGLGAKARRRAARTGRLALRVRTTGPGRVRAVARGRLGTRKVRRLGSASRNVRRAGTTRLTLRLNRPARRRLRSGRAIRVRVRVAQSGARTRSITVRLARGARS